MAPPPDRAKGTRFVREAKALTKYSRAAVLCAAAKVGIATSGLPHWNVSAQLRVI